MTTRPACYETINTDTRRATHHGSLRDARREARRQGCRFAGEPYECPHTGRRVLPLYRTLREARAVTHAAPAVLITATPRA